uniref:Transcription initiation factor TFIID subunit 9 n=1 Tax=Aegilops tauschii subsp. strangulata TaxID=200361 RepID=A0A453G877_AEGTS
SQTMDGGGGVRPTLPSAAAGGASGPDEPRDARVVRELLRSIGLGEGEYEPRVVHQFLDLAYRYVGDVLGDAQVYADHAAKPQLDADDVRLAIQAKVNFSFSQPPPREGSTRVGTQPEQDPAAQVYSSTRLDSLATRTGHIVE